MRIFICFFALFLSALTVSAYFNSAEAGGRCSNPVKGDSDYDKQCGIWICLPGGFPSDCGAQKSAFIQRLGPGRLKPCGDLLPDYGRCIAEITASMNPDDIPLGTGGERARLGNIRDIIDGQRVTISQHVDITYPEGITNLRGQKTERFTYWRRGSGYVR